MPLLLDARGDARIPAISEFRRYFDDGWPRRMYGALIAFDGATPLAYHDRALRLYADDDAPRSEKGPSSGAGCCCAAGPKALRGAMGGEAIMVAADGEAAWRYPDAPR